MRNSYGHVSVSVAPWSKALLQQHTFLKPPLPAELFRGDSRKEWDIGGKKGTDR